MKKIVSAATGVVMLFCTGNAMATLYTLSDSVTFGAYGIVSESETINGVESQNAIGTTLDCYGGSYASILEGTGDYLSWTHNYSFEPIYDDLLSAELTLNLEDNGKACWFSWEIGIILTENGLVDITWIDTGDYHYNLNLTGIGDGSFQVGIIDIIGTFTVHSSTLDIAYSSAGSAAPVPEPATMALFGIGAGFAGMVTMRQKLRKKDKKS